MKRRARRPGARPARGRTQRGRPRAPAKAEKAPPPGGEGGGRPRFYGAGPVQYVPPGRVPRRPHGRAPRRPRGGGVPPVVFVAGGALALLLLGAVLVLGRGEDPARPARAVRRPPAVRSARPAVRAAPPAEGPSPSGEARSPSERALRVFAGDDAAEVETPEEEAERLRRVDAVYAEELEAARRADEEGSAGAQRPGEDAGD